MKFVSIHACNHVFDPQENRYLKSSASNLRRALGPAYAHLTRAQLLAQVSWQTCQSPNCKVRCCKDRAHLIGS